MLDALFASFLFSSENPRTQTGDKTFSNTLYVIKNITSLI